MKKHQKLTTEQERKLINMCISSIESNEKRKLSLIEIQDIAFAFGYFSQALKSDSLIEILKENMKVSK